MQRIKQSLYYTAIQEDIFNIPIEPRYEVKGLDVLTNLGYEQARILFGANSIFKSLGIGHFSKVDIIQTRNKIQPLEANANKYKVTSLSYETISNKINPVNNKINSNYDSEDIAAEVEEQLVAHFPRDDLEGLPYAFCLLFRAIN